jgi:hypothetical protein
MEPVLASGTSVPTKHSPLILPPLCLSCCSLSLILTSWLGCCLLRLGSGSFVALPSWHILSQLESRHIDYPVSRVVFAQNIFTVALCNSTEPAVSGTKKGVFS